LRAQRFDAENRQVPVHGRHFAAHAVQHGRARMVTHLERYIASQVRLKESAV